MGAANSEIVHGDLPSKDELPIRRSMTLIDNGSSVRMSIMSEVIEQCGREPGEEVPQVWLPDRELLIIDMGYNEQSE